MMMNIFNNCLRKCHTVISACPTADFIKQNQAATNRSLILLDEIGRGTSTYDGMALAQAIVEYIHHHIQAKTLFSTHYHELTALEDSLPQLKNIHVRAEE